MNALSLSLAYLRRRPLNTALNLVLLALGAGTIVLLLQFGDQLRRTLERDARGIDMVVGAKGSPMQLILSSVFHVDIPTGNVRVADARALAENPMIARVMPLALGDSFRGWRIVGTEYAYPALFGAEVVRGALWHEPLEATVGARVAAEAGLDVGAEFVGSHGLTIGGAAHEEAPYRVTGVFAETGTVLDRLILTSVESVWEVHEHHSEDDADHEDHGRDEAEDHGDEHDSDESALHEDDGHDEAEDHGDEHGSDESALHEDDGHDEAEDHGDEHDPDESALFDDDPDREVTALLIQLRNPVGAAVLPRQINMTTPMQAALPGFEIARLMKTVGFGIDGFRAFAWVLVASAGLGIFTALYNALAQRRYDIAVMRALGAPRGAILRQIVLEGCLLTLAGTVLGVVLGHVAAEIAGIWLWREHRVPLDGLSFVTGELWLLAGAVALGVGASLIPALQARRMNISAVLARG